MSKYKGNPFYSDIVDSFYEHSDNSFCVINFYNDVTLSEIYNFIEDEIEKNVENIIYSVRKIFIVHYGNDKEDINCVNKYKDFNNLY